MKQIDGPKRSIGKRRQAPGLVTKHEIFKSEPLNGCNVERRLAFTTARAPPSQLRAQHQSNRQDACYNVSLTQLSFDRLQEYHVDSGYYYNALHRWYYDLKSTMYYGGDPPEWTANPPLPADARYAGAAQPRAAPGGAAPASKAAVSGPASRQHGAAVASAAVAARTVVPGSKVSQAHPLAGVGGYQMPSVGKIGGAKGLGAQDSGKRKRDEGPGGGTKKPVSKEEAEALARREAARQRVQARTMASFGLQ